MVVTLTSLTDQILDRLETKETVRTEASLDDYWKTLADLAEEPTFNTLITISAPK